LPATAPRVYGVCPAGGVRALLPSGVVGRRARELWRDEDVAMGEQVAGVEPITVLICDDENLVGEAIARSLRHAPGVRISASAVSDPREAVKTAERDRPDMVLMDLHFTRGFEGLRATREILEVSPSTRVVILTGDGDESISIDAIEVGAVGVIPRVEGLDVLDRLIVEVMSGATLVLPDRFPSLIRAAGTRRAKAREAESRIARLTAREREILILLSEGLSNEAVAERLFISDRTVETHVRNLLRKLGVASKLQAVIFGVRHGIVVI
jgi:DNA-binding NarL/FixJ family response regulator